MALSLSARWGSRVTADDDKNYGLTHLNPRSEGGLLGEEHDQQKPFEVDIIAIHGINGHAIKSWTHETGAFWLRDFLPRQFPGARVFTFGYESKVAFTHSTGVLDDFARSLLVSLMGSRTSEEVGRRVEGSCLMPGPTPR